MHDRLTELRTSELISRLATSDPAPGGGSAAALAGALAAGLVEMVVALTSGRAAAAEHEAELTSIGSDAMALRQQLVELTDADASAYEAVVAARRLSRTTDLERIERDARLGDATIEATLIPLRTLRAAAEVFDLAERLAPIGNRNASSDVGVAALLASTAAHGAALNVRINLAYLADGDPLADQARAEIAQRLEGLDRRAASVLEAIEAGIG
ncbi:MAG TPA: cyclodeaminase/cyclohydrolase family protein [Candidatus Limnocylindria bacterium]|jgi:glutamate formiminotransferase/formiminotetrahydrofolate cyclodeaminase